MAAASVVVSVAAALHVNDTNDLLRIANTPHHREGTRLFEPCCTNHGKRKEPPYGPRGRGRSILHTDAEPGHVFLETWSAANAFVVG